MKKSVVLMIILSLGTVALSGCMAPSVAYSMNEAVTACENHQGVNLEATRNAPKRTDSRIYLYDYVCKDGFRVSYSWEGFLDWRAYFGQAWTDEEPKAARIHPDALVKLEYFCHERGADLQEQFVVLYERGKPLPFKYTARCLDGTIFSLDV